jgi:membrane-bound lytic murein transglycosylase B
MLHRRSLLAATPALLAGPAFASPAPETPHGTTAAEAASFRRYLAGIVAEAAGRGIPSTVARRALAGLAINWKVIALDHNQPEVKLTWEQYRTRIVSAHRIAEGRVQLAHHLPLLRRVQARYGVPPGILIGLWGLESDFGRHMGHFNVLDAVATLAWQGRRGAYFRGQLLDALKIIAAGDIPASEMVGSWAGAMGQTQFMPDCFLRYAVDFDGDGRRDLWHSLPDVFASTANNLAAEGWNAAEPWGTPVALPSGFDAALVGRGHHKPVAGWLALGVRPLDGRPPRPESGLASIVLPDTRDAYLVYASNFRALRAYNPSDYYALSIGLLADRISA